jgi:hypothetical protein
MMNYGYAKIIGKTKTSGFCIVSILCHWFANCCNYLFCGQKSTLDRQTFGWKTFADRSLFGRTLIRHFTDKPFGEQDNLVWLIQDHLSDDAMFDLTTHASKSSYRSSIFRPLAADTTLICLFPSSKRQKLKFTAKIIFLKTFSKTWKFGDNFSQPHCLDGEWAKWLTTKRPSENVHDQMSACWTLITHPNACTGSRSNEIFHLFILIGTPYIHSVIIPVTNMGLTSLNSQRIILSEPHEVIIVCAWLGLTKILFSAFSDPLSIFLPTQIFFGCSWDCLLTYRGS